MTKDLKVTQKAADVFKGLLSHFGLFLRVVATAAKLDHNVHLEFKPYIRA